MFVKKHFIYLGSVYLKMDTVLWSEIFVILFLCKAEDIGRFVYIRWYIRIDISVPLKSNLVHLFLGARLAG